MKLDFIDTGDEDSECNRLIRLYDFNCDQVALLHRSVLDLANGALEQIAVHRQEYVDSAKIELTLKPADDDLGIWPKFESSMFECQLTRDTWANVAGYMEPFLTACDPNTFQWLDEPFKWTDKTSEICFLFSPGPEGYW